MTEPFEEKRKKKAWAKEALSDPNGIIDDARIAAAVMVLTFCACAVIALLKGQTWNPQEFGIGAGALTAGLGAWFGMRKDA